MKLNKLFTMKTKILLLTFLTFVFTAIGQITPDLIPGDDNHVVALSPNGEYLVVAADGDLGGSVPSGDGLLRVYQRNGDNTFSMINEFFLPKGNTVDAAVGFLNSKTTAITNTGDYYIFFEDGICTKIFYYICFSCDICAKLFFKERNLT